MGAPKPDMAAADEPAAESLLSAFKTIDPSERRKHASVLNYWLSIRGDKEFPPLHDLDPLEISDAAPCSILLELISGGHDAEIRHLGEALKAEGKAERMIDAPNPSILASIAKKLPIVAISRDFLAFEDEYSTADASIRCWVTLLPLSAGGAWVDYVYAFVSLDKVPVDTPKVAKQPAKKAAVEEPPVEVEAVVEDVVEAEPHEPIAEAESPAAVVEEPEPPAPPVEEELALEAAPSSQPEESSPALEGSLQSKLAEVREKADEARMAKLKANVALYEGLGAAYDFALDAEDAPEQYLKLVEAQGLKIQLRAPMTPVVKLAFNGLCDDATIAQLEAVLAWALDQNLPRGGLAERIEAAGGIARILSGEPEAS
jgi:hypothetical protein